MLTFSYILHPVQKAKKPKLKKEERKIQEVKVVASLLPVLIDLHKKSKGENLEKEQSVDQPLTPDMIDLIIQQKLS